MRRRGRAGPRRLLLLAIGLPLLALLGWTAIDRGAAATAGPAAADGVLFVANLRSSEVSLVDVASGREIGRWPTPSNPHEFASDGEAVHWSNYRSDGVSTLRRSLGSSPTTRSARGPRPHGIALDGQGRLWWSTADGVLHSSDGAAITVGAVPHALVIDQERGQAFLADAANGAVVQVDLAEQTVVGRAPAGALAESLALTAAGDQVIVAAAEAGRVTAFTTDGLQARWRTALAGRPVRVVVAGDQVLVSLAFAGELAILALDDGSVLGRLAVGELPDGIAVDGSGRFAFVAAVGSDQVTIVDLDDTAVIGTLPSGGGPSGVLWLAK